MSAEHKSEESEKREYTPKDRRKALGAAYQILKSGPVQKRYDMTMFGLSASDPGGIDYYLTLDDVTNCLALLHNELATTEKAAQEA